MKFDRFTIVVTLLTVLFFAHVALAQAPVRRAIVFADSSTQANGCDTQQETFLIMDGTCASPGTTPWVQTLRIASNSVVINVPRAQVQRLTTTAACAPNAVPCLRVNDVPIPAGNVTLRWVTGAGLEGDASAAVPFSPAQVPPSAPVTVRVVPAP